MKTRFRFSLTTLTALLSKQGLMLRGTDDLPDSKEALDALISAASAKAVDEAVKGLKSKNTELLGSLKDAKDALAKFDGLDPEEMRTLLKRFANDEEAKLLKEGKLDELVSRRTEKLRSDLEKKASDALAAAEAATKRAQAFQGRVLDDSIRAAAAKAGLHQHAIDDALFRARSMFSLDENGQAVQLGDDGKPVLGKDGKSPFTPLEWLEGMKEKAPHWYPAAASGGGSGGGGGGAGGNGPAKANWTGSEAERVAAIRNKFPGLKSAV